MFCPECGTLAFPDSAGNINCTNYKCNYQGDADNEFTLSDGTKVNLAETTSRSKAETREYEVIDDGDMMFGVLTTDSYICPKCDCSEVFSELRQTRSSDEPETRFLTCKDCKHGWREY